MQPPRFYIGQKVTYLDCSLCPDNHQYENDVDNYYYGGAYDEIIGYVGEVLDIKMDEAGENHWEYDVTVDDVGNTYSMREYEFGEFYDIFPEDVEPMDAYIYRCIKKHELKI